MDGKGESRRTGGLGREAPFGAENRRRESRALCTPISPTSTPVPASAPSHTPAAKPDADTRWRPWIGNRLEREGQAGEPTARTAGEGPAVSALPLVRPLQASSAEILGQSSQILTIEPHG